MDKVYCVYNNCLKSSKIEYSANTLVFGRELTAPRDLFLDDIDRLESIRLSFQTMTLEKCRLLISTKLFRI